MMAFYQFLQEQKINASVEEVWDFVTSPNNLKKITPEYMGFNITSKNLDDKMYEGMIISYKVSPLPGIKMNWVTEITHMKEKMYFVDEQRIGPYRMWHHQHFLIPTEDGKVVMKDIVTYQPPFGILGALINGPIIRKQLKQIFAYRRKAIGKWFKKLEVATV